MQIEIKKRGTGLVLYSGDHETTAEAVTAAIKSNTNLRDANLLSADLRDADLRDADLRDADLSPAPAASHLFFKSNEEALEWCRQTVAEAEKE